MILDGDFDIFEGISKAAKFTGKRTVRFTSNIRNYTLDNRNILGAAAQVLDNEGKSLYNCVVVFDTADTVYRCGTYYAPGYTLPVKYHKSQRIEDRGVRIKNNSFELFVDRTETRDSNFYNRKTGNNELTHYYYIFTKAESLKKIESIDCEQYNSVKHDTAVQNTNKIESATESFNGHHHIQFTTGVYRNNDGLFAKANVNGRTLVISMNNVEMKISEPNRWAPYYIYRPILKGRGTTIKNNFFDVDVVETQVVKKNSWNEAQQATVVDNKYVLVVNPETIKKTK